MRLFLSISIYPPPRPPEERETRLCDFCVLRLLELVLCAEFSMLALSMGSCLSLQLPRRTALCAAGAALAVTPQLPASAETVKEIVRRLDSTASRNADGDPAEHLCEIVVGQPGFDAWCPVEISAPYVVGTDGHHVDYLWLKDSRTASTQRIFAARAFERTDPTIPRLVQNLKKGSVFRPMAYCSAHGLWEGEPITV